LLALGREFDSCQGPTLSLLTDKVGSLNGGLSPILSLSRFRDDKASVVTVSSITKQKTFHY
jgi:hypothetical protein